jgi:ribosomal protein S28E/S33
MLNIKKAKILEKIKRSGTYGQVIQVKTIDESKNYKIYKVLGPCNIGEYLYYISDSNIE